MFFSYQCDLSILTIFIEHLLCARYHPSYWGIALNKIGKSPCVNGAVPPAGTDGQYE